MPAMPGCRDLSCRHRHVSAPPVRNGRSQHRTHALFSGRWIISVRRVEHRNHSDRPGAIFVSPLARHQRLLHSQPVVRRLIEGGRHICGKHWRIRCYRPRPRPRIDHGQKCVEMFQVHAHLVNQLRHRHLLRSGKLIEVPAVGARVVNCLDRSHAHQLGCVFVGDLRREAKELPPPGALAPILLAFVEHFQNVVQPRRLETCRLPQVRRRGLQERMRI